MSILGKFTDGMAHITFQLNCESETDWYLYEGATINTAGTTITPYNNNRNSANTSGMTIAGILNSNLANANADTDVSGATQIRHGIIGAGKNNFGTDSRENENILKQNEIYCIRFVASAAGYVNYDFGWYEHEDKE